MSEPLSSEDLGFSTRNQPKEVGVKQEGKQDPGIDVRLQGQKGVSTKFDLDLSSLLKVSIS